MFYPIECVFHVYFNNHSFFFVRYTGVDCFLDQDYIILDLYFCHETPLVGEDNSWKKVLKPGGNNFGKDFVGDITEGDGAKAVKRVCIFGFGDQRQEGGVGGSSYLACRLNISNHAN